MSLIRSILDRNENDKYVKEEHYYSKKDQTYKKPGL